MGLDIFLQGLYVTVVTMAAYFIGHYMEAGVWETAQSADGMTMAFLALSMTEIFHSFNMRSRRGSIFLMKTQNVFLWGAMIASLLCTVVVIYVPFLADAFGFEDISLAEYIIAIGLAVTVIPMVELIKLLQRRFSEE
jgi:Ca2+-transporting ATPase